MNFIGSLSRNPVVGAGVFVVGNFVVNRFVVNSIIKQVFGPPHPTAYQNRILLYGAVTAASLSLSNALLGRVVQTPNIIITGIMIVALSALRMVWVAKILRKREREEVPFDFSFQKNGSGQVGVCLDCYNPADLKKLYDKILQNEKVMEFCEFNDDADQLIETGIVKRVVLKFKEHVPTSLQKEEARSAVVDFLVGKLGGTPEGKLSMD